MLLDLGDLRVRSWRKGDLDSLVHYANNPNIAANLRDQFPHPYTPVCWCRFPGRCALGGGRNLLRSGICGWRPLAAWVSSWAPTSRGSPLKLDIGWRAILGQGLTTRAVLATSDWAFQNYKLARIFAMAFYHNVASMRVLEKAGFQREGTLRCSAVKNGIILDQVLYAKIR